MNATNAGEALEALLEPVRAIAEAAGREILSHYGGDCAIQEKADQTPLTVADLAAHEAVVTGLAALTPELPILSEESAEIPYPERAAWSRYWLVDPLDGTRHFIRGDGEFCVNIALIDEHRPLLGVIHAPVTGVSYWARLGGGAWRHDKEAGTRAIHTRAVDEPLTLVTGRFQRGPRLEALIERLDDPEILTLGSALKSCLVAEGGADLYARLGPTSEWDTAAAQCIVEEAGGALTDTEMRPLRYNTKESLNNPHFLAIGDRDHDWAALLANL